MGNAPFKCTAHDRWPCEECMRTIISPIVDELVPRQHIHPDLTTLSDQVETLKLVVAVLDKQLARSRDRIAEESRYTEKALTTLRMIEAERDRWRRTAEKLSAGAA